MNTWTPPDDERIDLPGTAKIAWTPPADERIGDVDNRRWDQRVADFLQPISNYADKVQAAAPYVLGALNPAGLMTDLAMAKVNEAAGAVAQPVTEFAARKGVPGPAAAALGVGASVAANPFTYASPLEGIAGKALEPVVPAARQAAVTAAQDIGMQLRRGELTGGKFSLGLSNLMEKTPLGAGPEDAFTAKQYAALGAEKARLQEAMGTGQDAYAAGLKSQAQIPVREAAMSEIRDKMFNQIPDDVYIPLKEYENIGNVITQEQSKVRPLARNAEVSKFAADAQNPLGSTGEGVTGGPEYAGVSRSSRPLPEYEPGTIKEPHFVFQGNIDFGGGDVQSQYILRGEHPRSGGNFNAQQVKAMGYPVVGATGKGIGQIDNLAQAEPSIMATVGPDDKFAPKSNYHDIKALRETLNGKIQEARRAGNFQTERHFLRMKDALDKDIDNFVNGQTSPLGNMVAQEFSDTYKKANAFSGAFKNLYKSGDAETIKNLPPEQVIKSVFTPNNETAIKQFRALAGEEGFAPVKQKFTQDLLESGNVTKELEKLKGSVNAIYTPAELAELQRYGLAQSVPKSVPALQGTHGSARANTHAASWGGLFAGLGSLATGNIPGALTGIGQFVAPAAISRINLATARGVPYSLGRGTQALTRGATAAEAIDRKRAFMSEYLKRFVVGKQ